MRLSLNIYTDESLTEVKRVAEADRLKIPYRVALTVAQTIDELDLNNLKDKDVLSLITGNLDKVDKIIKATFALSELEMDCIDLSELGAVTMEIYRWAIGKFNELKGGRSKNE